MGRPLLPLLLLVFSASVFSDKCEEIASSVVFNQIAISNLLSDQNSCASEAKANGQALIAKVEAIDHGLKQYFANMQGNFTEVLKTWITTTLNEHSEVLKTWITTTLNEHSEELKTSLSERMQNISESLTAREDTLNETVNVTPVHSDRVMDCKSHKLLGETTTGTYDIYPLNCSTPVKVWCDMETDGGGWSLMVKRKEHTPQVDFRVDWDQYKKGFGDTETEYWLGNDVIHALTKDMKSHVRIDGEAFSSTAGKRHGYWEDFYIEDEANNYIMHITEMKGSKSTMGDALFRSNSNKFTTIDRDNDSRGSENCAADYGGGGWWYDSCSNAFPTAPIIHTDKWDDSLNMYKWVPGVYGYSSLRWVELKLRAPSNAIRYCKSY